MKKQIIQLSQYTAAYTKTGTGKAILFLHGFFGDAEKLEPIITELQDSYCCIAIDLLGFGDSSKPNIQYHIDHQVNFLQEFIHALNLESFMLAGYSYGAWVAAAYAIAMDNLKSLEGLVLIAPTGIRDDSFVGRYDYLKPLLWNTPVVDIVLWLLQPFALLIGQGKYFKTIRQARRSIQTQPAAKSFLSDRLTPEDAVDTVEKDIHRITVPALIIAGEIDQHIPLWHSQAYAQGIPQGHLAIVKGANHDLVETHGFELTQLIKTHFPNPVS